MAITVNGADVTKLSLWLPPQRVWSGMISAVNDDSHTEPPTEGTVVNISDGTVSLVGVVIERRDKGGSSALLVQGGAGKLGTVLAAKHYQQPSKLAVASDIIKESGETLDAASTVTGTFSAFSRHKGPASVQLDETGLQWRMTAAGQIFVGAPAFGSVVDETRSIRDLYQEQNTGAYVASVEGFDLEPGKVFRGKNVTSVRYSLTKKLEVRYYVAV